MKLNALTRKDWLLGIAIAVFIFFYIHLTSSLIGLVRDEGFYNRTAEITANWYDYIGQSFSKGDFLTPFKPPAIKRYFEENHEHPTFVKNIFGLSHYIFFKKNQILSFENSIRIVAAMFAALTALMIFLFGAMFFNRITAIFSPLLFFTMPHIFFHSHLACFDIPMLFFWSGTFILYAIYLVNRSRRIALFTAIFFGMAMATKHNSYFIPVLLVIVWIFWYFWNYSQQIMAHKGFAGFFKAVPLIFYLIPIVSVPVFFLFWPWIWYDTVARFTWYFNFHTMHVNYTNYYFGKELTNPPFPFSFPWAMTFFTTPVPQLVAFFAGIFLFIQKIIKSADRTEKEVHSVLLVGALFPIFLIAMPSVPIFGGIKHWFTGYPIMLTAGVFLVLQGMTAFIEKLPEMKRAMAQGVFFVLALLALIPANVKFSMHGAAFFNELIGGAQGAASNYMQRNFWGYDILPLVPTLNKVAPPNSRIYIMSWAEGLNPNSFESLKKEGIVRKDIYQTNEIKNADFAFFFYEKQNEHVLYSIYKDFGTAKPLALNEVDSVLFSALFGRVK